MMTDLFSSLDGAYRVGLYLPTLLILFFCAVQNYLSNSFTVIIAAAADIWKESVLFRYQPFKFFLTMLLILLVSLNFLGLTPFSYSLTSDLFTMSAIALLFWLTILVSGWIKAPTESAAHLAPQGAPLGLAPFLVIIETISILIRPLTLTVRLMANISAGHIVLGLLANSLTALCGSLTGMLLMIVSVGYMLFEFFVCIIQAYIFTLLISLYQTEHP